MSSVAAPTTKPVTARRLPLRDFLLLPALSISTVVVLFTIAEITARFMWPAGEQGYCMMFDPVAGPHGKPNCTAIIKIPEGQGPVVHTFNSCGYRSEAPCGPKPPNTTRIAMLGSSITEGYIIPYSQMMASQMTETLRRARHRPVEFQNLGAEGCPPIYAYRHLPEALKGHPDAVVLVLNPWDIEQDVSPTLLALRNDPHPINRAPTPSIKLNPLQQLQFRAHDSRTMLVAQHYMLQNQDTFLKLYLIGGGDHTDFVRYPFTSAWQRRFNVTELLLGEMADKLHAADIPFLVLAVPERAQLLMLNAHNLPASVDPYAFTRQMSQIAARHGILYVDGLKAFSQAPAGDQLFYIVDGHPNPEAHRIMGKAVAEKLMSENVVPSSSPKN